MSTPICPACIHLMEMPAPIFPAIDLLLLYAMATPTTSANISMSGGNDSEVNDTPIQAGGIADESGFVHLTYDLKLRQLTLQNENVFVQQHQTQFMAMLTRFSVVTLITVGILPYFGSVLYLLFARYP